eukprot:g2177.t1
MKISVASFVITYIAHRKRTWIMFTQILILAIALGFSSAEANKVWPKPLQVSTGQDTASVVFSKEFFKLTKVSPIVEAAFVRYKDIAFPHIQASSQTSFGEEGNSASMVQSLLVDFHDDEAADEYPQLGVNESYTFSVSSTGDAKISAQTVWGALRGLETFSQIVQFNFDTETYEISGIPLVVADEPRFSHRGLMIDSARHFETLAAIRSIIDSLPYAKMNTLHWHMVDTQSFPFESKTYPSLWKGAWSENERYTQDDIAAVVEYARVRGVRTYVEFDVPGHAASWCTGYPEICPSATCQQPLNVANNKTFDVIDAILEECTGGKTGAGLFPDHYVHLGGDEVDTSCWTNTPETADWLKARNMTGDDGYAYFVKRAADIALSKGRRPIQWSEVYDHFKTDLDKKTIVHVWKSVTNVTEVVANGYNVIRNVGYFPKSWYLDNLNVNWTAVYGNDPCDGVPDNLCSMILGGNGEMWGETVDASDLEQTVWPRLAAIAEKLWSARSDTENATEATPRIENFRCLLNRRGVRAAPVNNANAREAPPGPGPCTQ